MWRRERAATRSTYRDTKPFFCCASLLVTLSDRSKHHHSHPENYLPPSPHDITDVRAEITSPASPLSDCHLEPVSCPVFSYFCHSKQEPAVILCFPLLSQIFPICPKQHIFVLMQLSLVAARGREDSISSTYDSFVPNQVPGLPQRMKAGSLAVNGAPERVQKGADAVQQVGPSHAVTTLINLSPSVNLPCQPAKQSYSE